VCLSIKKQPTIVVQLGNERYVLKKSNRNTCQTLIKYLGISKEIRTGIKG